MSTDTQRDGAAIAALELRSLCKSFGGLQATRDVTLRIMPGDIVELKLKAEGASVTQEILDMERAKLGLDKPLLAQFGAQEAT